MKNQKIHCQYKKWLLTAILFPLSISTVLAAESYTGYTHKVGGSGGSSETRSCPRGSRITGLTAWHDGKSIIKMAFRCNKIAANGSLVNGSSTNTPVTSSNDLTQLANKRHSSAQCPAGKFMYAFRARKSTVTLGFSQHEVLTNISIKCKGGNSNGQQTGGHTIKSTSVSNRGSYSSWKYCPDRGIVSEAIVKSGARVDSIKFRCKKGFTSGTQGNNNPNPVEQSLYEIYRAYFGIVANGVNLKSLTPHVKNALMGIGIDNKINSLRIGYSPFLSASNTGMTDCNKVYFPNRQIVKILTSELTGSTKANKLRPSQLNWFIHELGHTKQCSQSGRSQFANRWFRELGPAILASIASLNPDPRVIHDKMPLESNAETFMNRNATYVRNRLNGGTGRRIGNQRPSNRPSAPAPTGRQVTAPVQTTPANNASVRANAPLTLNWSNVPAAKSYLVYLKDERSNLYINLGTGASSTSAPTIRVRRNMFSIPSSAMQRLSGKNLLWWIKACPNRNNSTGCVSSASSKRIRVQ